MTDQPKDLRAELASVLAEMRAFIDACDKLGGLNPTWPVSQETLRRWESALLSSHGGGGEAVDRERVAQLIAHRAAHSAEHNPENGKLHGYCLVCGVPWPCAYAGTTPQPRGGEMVLVPKEDVEWLADATKIKHQSMPYAMEALGHAKWIAEQALAAAPGEGSGHLLADGTRCVCSHPADHERLLQGLTQRNMRLGITPPLASQSVPSDGGSPAKGKVIDPCTDSRGHFWIPVDGRTSQCVRCSWCAGEDDFRATAARFQEKQHE